MTDRIEIFTDGACRGNPGIGGWGVVMRYKTVEKELSGVQPEATNNQMELMAAIQGLLALKRESHVTLVSDSQYLRRGMTEWLPQWKKNNWRTAAKRPVKNQSLWEQLDTLANKHHVKWEWVKGHSGHPENERCDTLANQAIDEYLAEQP